MERDLRDKCSLTKRPREEKEQIVRLREASAFPEYSIIRCPAICTFLCAVNIKPTDRSGESQYSSGRAEGSL